MRSLVLLSGGIDSAVCLAMLRGSERVAISVDYQQPQWPFEHLRAKEFAWQEAVNLYPLQLPRLPLINDVVWVGRNAILLSHAVALAQVLECHQLVIGCNADDAERFPDCRPEFINAMNTAFRAAYGVGVVAPLLRLTKPVVLQLARDLRLNPDDFWTCYSPNEGKPCGICHACRVMKQAQEAVAA